MVAPLLANEVQIRITCTSLCHNDITLWKLKVKFMLRLLCCGGGRRKYGSLFVWLWIVIDFYM